MSSKNSTKIAIAGALIVGGVLLYVYMKDESHKPHPPTPPPHPVNPIIIHTGGHHDLEPFAFSDIKNSYVDDGITELSYVQGANGENINGIFTNFKSDGKVLDVGRVLTNEIDMGQRDPRVIEGYIMEEHHYGAGTPNYRKLAGYY